MKVVITGGTGFIGRTLARRVLERGHLTGPSGRVEEIDQLLLFDAVTPSPPLAGLDDRVKVVVGDIAERAAVFDLIDRDDISVFHLASVVSGGGELDFDGALRVNLTGAINLLEACRARQGRPRVVFASSIAVFGGAELPQVVTDFTKQTPRTTYGTTKAIGEILINDYTRKGFLDGRTARLPTIIIRPGQANLAASGFASGLFREPLNGAPFALPVALETPMPVLGVRAAAAGFIHLHEIAPAALGDDRALNFPSLSVQVRDMVAALKRVAGERRIGAITVAPDPEIEAIVSTWPRRCDFARAAALGLPKEVSLEEIVEAYIEDFPPS